VTGRGLQYSGVMDCARQVVAGEGLRGLFKGWLPNFLRIGPHSMVTFMVFEELRKVAGLGAF